jgi:hypothetical protein
MKPMIVEKNNRKFICNISSDFGGAMCCVQIWEEVRPNWKIFRNRYCDYKTFWLSTYETLKTGVERMVERYLEGEEENNLINEKWKELDNGN